MFFDSNTWLFLFPPNLIERPRDTLIISFQYLHMNADIVFFMPMIKLADMISEWMKDVYVLSFEYISQNISGPDYIGNVWILLGFVKW